MHQPHQSDPVKLTRISLFSRAAVALAVFRSVTHDAALLEGPHASRSGRQNVSKPRSARERMEKEESIVTTALEASRAPTYNSGILDLILKLDGPKRSFFKLFRLQILLRGLRGP